MRVLLAPEVFSLVKAPDETVAFLTELKQQLTVPFQDLKIDLARVRRIDPEAVAAFVAVMESSDSSVGGNVPRDLNCRKRLHDFGFFEHVTGGPKLDDAPSGNIRLQHTGHVVDGSAAQEIIEFGLKKLGYQEPLKHGPAYNACTEAMANTHQHAHQQKGKKSWWAAVYYDPAKQTACFTLVDLGIGILQSTKYWHHLKFARGKGAGERLEMILQGSFPSRSGRVYRGRGLPNMKDACMDGRISNLVILSNNAFAHVDRGKYLELTTGFSGTIINWEVPGVTLQGETNGAEGG